MRNEVAMTVANRMALSQMRRRSRDEERSGASLSGHERDRLFLSSRGAAFTDVSGVSAVDDPSDGRAAGILDYDRDGWLDLALVSSNAPMLKLFRNGIGCHPAIAGRSPGAGRMLAVRFVGGNETARPARWSARDGFGAKVILDLGDRKILREHRAGEGFAAQNSATMVIGIGPHEVVRSVTVQWPGGRAHTATEIPAGTLLTVYENPARSPRGDAFVREPYAKTVSAAGEKATSPRPPLRRLTLPSAKHPTPRLRLYTTMATWCAACRSELPQFRRLRAAFASPQLAMAAVPIDMAESKEVVEAWGAAHKPVYDLLTGLSEAQVSSVKDLVLEELKLDAVPATIVTDGAGGVLLAQWGPPTISKIRELLAASAPAGTSPTAAGRCAN